MKKYLIITLLVLAAFVGGVQAGVRSVERTNVLVSYEDGHYIGTFEDELCEVNLK